jgi:hypothetical protein
VWILLKKKKKSKYGTKYFFSTKFTQKKTEEFEYVHRIKMPPASSYSQQEHNSITEKVVMSKIVLDLPFTVPNIVHKFQMIN